MMMDQVQKYVFPSIFNPVSHTLLNSVLWPVLSKQFSSRPERQSSARPPCPQVPQWHPRVAKRASIGTSARGLLPKVLQRHPSVAKRGFRPTLRHGTLNRTTSEMALRGEGTFSRIRIIKDYRTYFFNSNSGNLERKAICR